MTTLPQLSSYDYLNDMILPAALRAPPIASLIFSPAVFRPSDHAAMAAPLGATIYAGIVGRALVATVDAIEAKAMLTVAKRGCYDPALVPQAAHYAADVEMFRRRVILGKDDCGDILPDLLKRLRAEAAARARRLRITALRFAGKADRRRIYIAQRMKAFFPSICMLPGTLAANINGLAGKRGVKPDPGIETAARLLVAVALERELDPDLFPHRPIPKTGGELSCDSLLNFVKGLSPASSA